MSNTIISHPAPVHSIKMTVSWAVIIYFIFNCFSCKEINNDTNQDFCSSIHASDSRSIRDHLYDLDSLLQNTSGAYTLEEGDISMIARAWLTEHATKTIDIQYFIFSVDNVGLIACDYIVRAADRGVKVRILVDDIMVEAEPNDIMVMAAHPNIEIKIYNPVVNVGKNILEKVKGIVTDFKGINQRMHNKIFIADDLAAITGGRNIADEYFDYDHEYNFRDRDIFLIGDIIQDCKTTFDLFWNHTLSVPIQDILTEDKLEFHASDRYDKLHNYACDSLNYWPQVRQKVQDLPYAFHKMVESGNIIFTDSLYFVSDLPGKNETKGLLGGGKTTTELIRLFDHAKFSVDIQSPYLVTTELGQNLFRKAIQRGVKVRILTNSLASTDNLEAFGGYQRDRQKLLQMGVEIYEFRPDAACRFEVMTGALQKEVNYTPCFGLHAKTMVIDKYTSVIGTFNLDPRSANLNTECFIVAHSQQLTNTLLKNINHEFEPENAWKITKDWNPDNLVDTKKRWKTKIRRVVPKSIL